MAMSQGRMRTNYFRTTDVEKLEGFVAKAQDHDGEEVTLFNEIVDGEILYGFGCMSQLQGYYDDEAEEYNFDAFLHDLQTVVASGDSIIIMEVGYEKLRYVYSTAVIVTSEKIQSMDFTQLVLQKAAEVVGNPDYQTRIEY